MALILYLRPSLGTLFLAASLTPTLLPRSFLTQGVLSGCSLAAGYGIGVFGRWLWAYMELPHLRGYLLRVATLVTATACAVVAALFLWQMARWQNSIRELMELDPVETAYPLEVGLMALALFAILLAVSRLFRLTLRFVTTRGSRFLTRRVANVIGVIASVALFWSVISGVLFRVALHLAELVLPAIRQADRTGDRAADRSSKDRQQRFPARMGRTRTAGTALHLLGANSEGHQHLSGREALEPLRIYIGLRSADTLEARAKLALEELKRAGGFKRSVLIVATPTGTGWVDPAALDSLEYLHDGDVASVALQYSYLASWLALLVEPDYGADAARALFREIYGYWTTLPKDSRPKLYLHGLSLGALNSQQSTDLIEVLGDPFAGALWSGPPYSSRLWRFLTDQRDPGSPAWLPRFRDGSFVRFMNQHGEAPAPASAPNAVWGPIRIVYLQYASDPVTFFEYRSLYREPDWMMPPRGPDVSPQLRWYPVVTLLQLTLDNLMATTAPVGFGHVYAPAHYIDAWIQVTDIHDWSPKEIARLKQHLSEQ